MSVSITWLGHSAFLVELPSKQRLLFDPWLGNPRCPEVYRQPAALGRVDLVLVSHGHDDHAADLAAISRATGAPIVCIFELGQFLKARGLKNVCDMGIGGTQHLAGLSVTMTQAVHSGSTLVDGQIVYLGGAAGFVVRAAGAPTIYFAGDTALFGDMKLIGDVYAPAIAFLPIGDHYTMGPDAAAMAAKWLGVRQVVPMHWGTFPVLSGTPAMLEEHVAGTGIDVLTLAPGETAS